MMASIFPIFGILDWWQLLLAVLLVALLLFWKWYRNKSM